MNLSMNFGLKSEKNDGRKHLNDPNALIKCSNNMDDVCGDIDNYNQTEKEKS